MEISLLIDVFEKFKLASIAQVDMEERVHKNQSLDNLSKMAFAITQTLFKKLERRYGLQMLPDINRTMKNVRYEAGHFSLARFKREYEVMRQLDLAGVLFPDIKAQYGKEFAAREANPLTVSAPNGETVGQVRDRVFGALKDIAQKYPNRRVAVVAHGLVLALIKVYAYDHPITKVWDLVPPNAESEEIEIGEMNGIFTTSS